jgi:hypothetical protein
MQKMPRKIVAMVSGLPTMGITVITDIDLSKDIPGDFQELTHYIVLMLIHYNRSTPGTFGLLEFVRFSIWNQNWKSQLRAP